MSQPSAQRAFHFAIFFLLVVYAAWLASVGQSSVSVSHVSARHVFSSLTSPQNTKVAVPFGIRDRLLFSAVQPLDQNLTAASEDVRKRKVSKRATVPSW